MTVASPERVVLDSGVELLPPPAAEAAGAVAEAEHAPEPAHGDTQTELLLMFGSVMVALAGIGLATVLPNLLVR